MNERQVSLDNQTWTLPRPFFVIATQNPYEHYGTYPLPESQRDRFLLRLSIGYPERRFEKEILREEISFQSVETLSPVTSKENVARCIEEAKKVRVDESLDDYLLALVEETRKSPFLELGVSPRGSLALRRTAQAHAFLEGRDYLVPDDIKKNAVAALSHRVILKAVNGAPESEATRKVVREILDRVPVPA